MLSGIINTALYENAKEFLGIANITMPTRTAKTLTVNGAGIAGDVDVPVYGHNDAMRMTISFTDATMSAAHLAEQRVHQIDFRVAHEDYNSVSGQIEIVAHKYSMRVMPISTNGGTVAPASQQGLSVECTVLSYIEYINDVRTEYYDPVNFVDVDASGTDRLADVRAVLGK